VIGDEPVEHASVSEYHLTSRNLYPIVAAKPQKMTEPAEMFPRRSDAALYLSGLGGFWISWGLTVAVALAQGGRSRSPFILVGAALVLSSYGVLYLGLRRMEINIRGDKARPWPRGPSMGTQLRGALPSTMSLAGRRLGFNGRLVAVALYSALVLDGVLFVLLIVADRRH
jgi:hypothetical protein